MANHCLRFFNQHFTFEIILTILTISVQFKFRILFPIPFSVKVNSDMNYHRGFFFEILIFLFLFLFLKCLFLNRQQFILWTRHTVRREKKILLGKPNSKAHSSSSGVRSRSVVPDLIFTRLEAPPSHLAYSTGF